METLRIGPRPVGPGHPVFVIAEAGVNHNGDPDLARRLIDAAREVGADAVKFQTFKAEHVVSAGATKAEYQKRTTGTESSQFEMLRALELSEAALRDLRDHCRATDMAFLSTPFDSASAQLLTDLGAPAFKVGSGELTNLPFLRDLAAFGKPIILSSGMAQASEVAAAIQTVVEGGAPAPAVLHCVSNYPASPVDVNLRAMTTMADLFGVPVGYSDHTVGDAVSLAAVARGACIIEKHLTLDRSLPGPDHAASEEPAELARLIAGIRTVEAALGDGRKRPAASEAEMRVVARRSLITRRPIRAGETFAADDFAALRPGSGLSPARRDQVFGRRARHDLDVGVILTWQDIA